MSLAELKKNVGNKKLILGLGRAMKNLKKGEVKELYIASNCSPDIKGDLESVAKKTNVKIFELEITNDEMGVVVKKPFAVSVIALLK